MILLDVSLGTEAFASETSQCQSIWNSRWHLRQEKFFAIGSSFIPHSHVIKYADESRIAGFLSVRPLRGLTLHKPEGTRADRKKTGSLSEGFGEGPKLALGEESKRGAQTALFSEDRSSIRKKEG